MEAPIRGTGSVQVGAEGIQFASVDAATNCRQRPNDKTTAGLNLCLRRNLCNLGGSYDLDCVE